VFPFLWTALVVLQSLVWLLAVDLAYGIAARVRRPLRTRWHAAAVLAIVGFFAVYTPVRMFVEHDVVRVRHHHVGGASSAAPFRIGFVADIQQDRHTDGDRAREIYALVNASRPDVVLSGGDWINTGPDDIEASAEAATTLQSRLGTFSVRGDHEHYAYFDRERSVTEVEAAIRQRATGTLPSDGASVPPPPEPPSGGAGA
jgi:predicted MPP superfamily phosphohydrolase